MRRGAIGLAVVVLMIAVATMIVTGCRREPAGSDTNSCPRAESPGVQEWEVLSREQAGLPEVSQDELVARVQKWVEMARGLLSWEAHYEATFAQMSPSVRETARVRMVSAGEKWAVHLLVNPDDATRVQGWQAACDGSTIRLIWPDSKQAQILKAGERAGLGSAPALPAFLPQLPSVDALRWGVDVRDAFGMLNAPEVRLSPSCTRVDGNPCYVLERAQTLEYPVFRTDEQADRWLQEHAGEGLSADGSLRPLVVIDPHTKADQKIVCTLTTRLAVDPNVGFAVARWDRRGGMQMPDRSISLSPDREVVYRNFHKIGEALYLPWHMEFTIYHPTAPGRAEVFQQFTLDVEDILVPREHEAGLFEPAIPEGYAVTDVARGIGYTAGDPQEKVDALIAAAKARDEFYRRLQEGPAPSLEASTWLVGGPIDLDKYKGRAIVLHFWGIDCAPCTYELPRLQDQYGGTMQNTREPLFVSIHPHVEGAELKRVQQLVKQQGITFPMMIDTPPPWGRTFRKYRIFGIPSEVKIDESGRVGETPKELISESSWWVSEGRDE
jgi:peroxiredoxin